MDMTKTEGRRGFLVQELHENQNIDLTPASQHVEQILHVLPSGDDAEMNTYEMIRRAFTVLHDFTDDDAIIPIGGPVAIGIVCAVASRLNDGRFKVLKWDKFHRGPGGWNGGYIEVPVNINILEKLEEEKEEVLGDGA